MTEKKHTMQERPLRDREGGSPLADRVLLISGGAGTLPPRLAESARRRGAQVALAMPQDALEPPPRSEGGICLLAESPGDAAGCERLIEAVLERFSRLDAVIAIVPAPRVQALDALTLAQWEQRVIDPLERAFWLLRGSVWEFLAAGGGGRLVLVTEPPPTGDPNEIIGAALRSLARSVAKEVGPRAVACNAVLAVPGGPAGSAAGVPQGDPLRPIVEAALYLASDDASFVNGEALTVLV